MTVQQSTDAGFDPFPAHFLAAVTIRLGAGPSGGRVVGYGQEVLVTPAMRRLNLDRSGRCKLLDLIDDEDAQVRAWGRVVIRRGSWPEGVSRLERGSHEWDQAREAARRQAHLIEDEAERQSGLRRVTEEFGSAPSTSKTLGYYR